MANILVYIELVDDQASWASLLTLRQGRSLATRLGATLYAVLPCASPPLYGDNDIIAVLSRQGADKVILMTHAALAEPALFRRHGDALLTAASQFPPSLLLLPRGPAASDLAPRVAARLGALFLQEPLLDVDSGSHLVMQQPTSAGTQVRRYSTAELEHPVVAVVAPDPQRFSRADGCEEAEVVVLSPVFKACTDGAEPEDTGTAAGCLPERVILVGGDVATHETWEIIRQLAARLGAELRQTHAGKRRNLAPEVELLGPCCPGGLPGFVLALGVGGDDEPLGQIPTSTYLLAVHPDRDAPVFGRSKLALAAEVHAAVMEMLSAAGPRPAARSPTPEEPATSPTAFAASAAGHALEAGPAPETGPAPEAGPAASDQDRSNAPTVELPATGADEDAP